jgi:ribonucleotide reductase alpha subunit
VFRLSDSFIEKYENKKSPFTNNVLGELVYIRTYSRIKEDGNNEQWFETVRRVVEGTYTIQKKWIEEHQLGWNNSRAQKSAQEMYDRMFNMKFLPPGRGLWAMGSDIINKKELYAALNNCSFVSTSNLKDDLSKPFLFLMDMSMLGVGVGFDTKGAEQIIIKGPNNRKKDIYVIPDSREGWVESVKLLLDSYFLGGQPIEFDYSQIRPEGLPIKTFGGISSGPEPLKELHKQLEKVLDKEINQPISITSIVDIMNLIGKCVVSGNVRRSAEIVFGDYKSEEYLDLKNYKKNKHRETFGWSSNNSIFADLGMDYTESANRTKLNGEPGYAWLENMKNYSRMNNGPDYKDKRVAGGNPCLAGDTLILTTEGEIKISELTKRWNIDNYIPPIYTFNEKNKEVELDFAIFSKMTKKDTNVIKIITENNIELTLTPDHKIFTENRGWVEAAKITENDVIFMIE